jgi:UDPglucose 6-dehydrogenase
MKLCVIGTGYVGLVSGACFADAGNHVTCVDINAEKVRKLKEGHIPIYEPGLEEVVRRNEQENRLEYTTELAEGLKDSEVCFVTVDTPPDGDGKADLTNVLAVAKQIGTLLSHYTIVVTKSTVPVGTTFKVKEVISAGLKERGLDPAKILDVASNPEFLKEGDAVNDFMKPDRVVVGVEKDVVGDKLHELYTPFMRRGDRFIRMNVQSSELTKYAANAMLATRISFMNEMARLCDVVGADITDIRNGLGSDPRIGPNFLYAGLGYGGSCFPKDTKAIIQLGKEHNSPLSVIESVDSANDEQRNWFWKKVCDEFGGEENLNGKRIGIWGLAFKANTDDVRFAPSLDIINKLVAAGATVSTFDPIAEKNAKKSLGDVAKRVRWTDNYYGCVEGADALIICTEWREFRSPDFEKLKSLMGSPKIFDGRNLYDSKSMQESGFKYFCVGRNIK